ncbi:uncharacterized protein LOC142987673 [Anticarsia gemmatalis]|uniref:uncharacterized protein LOC142987673 n=1 Tax=Anticarsia gemmatalis TaxID=129554 RepID=UPI003F758D3B
MIQKFAVLSCLVLSASCMLLHQAPIPVLLGLQYNDNPNYNFAYEVNDGHTGDIKSQHETRRGDTVLGQYSLLQPDGVQRTVDYRADDHTGFQATVNNEGRQTNGHAANININNDAVTRHPSANLPSLGAVQSYQTWPTVSAPHPAPTAAPSPVPVAISRSSFVQTISHGPVPTPHNVHNLWA